ncbi:D-alanyl-D-alanine carboxypeptidase family protein [Megasphaera vaginalis (ex Bordigoni et al. 2020)]|uniref:D-alanyl-D-alanine carboxypeptidase family protein n=2 Tax=Megasphaera TaxID=906 RepID=UPI000C7A5B1D|nr:D-alanyl-D-alanine carboxypeptidase [Megasphaera vaginalis (ex Bordigoni et al. 2020)]
MFLKKRMFTLSVICLTVSSLTAVAAMPERPEIRAAAAYVTDCDTGAALYAKNADAQVSPGGTTMMMTAILGLELGQGKMDRNVTIAPESTQLDSDVAVLGLRADRTATLGNALAGMMTYSGCDAAMDIAATVASSQRDFVDKMNDKALAIGAVHTHFTNPSGLPESGHYSTAADLAKIAAYGMKNSDFRTLVSRSSYEMTYSDGDTETLTSLNELLAGQYGGANGVRTGSTDNGGPCLIASATREGKTLVAAVMNSSDRFGDAAALLDYGFAVLKEKGASGSDFATATAGKSDENPYVLRDAPAGQTLSQLAAEQAAAAQHTQQSAL